MGYFDFLRSLDAELNQLTAAAEQAADRVQTTAELIETVRPKLNTPRFVDIVYARCAAALPDVALARERVRAAIGRDAEAGRALMASGCALAAPYLISQLFTANKDGAAKVLGQLYPYFEVPYGAVLTPLVEVEGLVGFFALLALNISPFPDEQARGAALFAESTMPDGWKEALRTRTALAGVGRFDAWVVDRLNAAAKAHQTRAETAIADGAKQSISRKENSSIANWCVAAGTRKLTAAVPALCALLHSFDALEALDALGAIGDPQALPAVQAYRATLAGQARNTLPFRLAADNALSQLGLPQSVDTAHETLRSYHPKRYGYPKAEHLLPHWRRALEALATRGDADDQAAAAGWIAAPWADIRTAAATAWQALHGAPPHVEYWDKARVEQVADAEGQAPLLHALPKINTAFRHRIFEYLIEHGNADAHRDAACWLREALENRPNLYAHSRSELPPDVQAMVKALKGVSDAPTVAAALAGTTSAWLNTFVLGGEKMEKPPYHVGTAFSGTINAEGTVPFKYGRHINGLAISPDGRQMAVVGENYGRIDHLADGAIGAWLELRWGWAYDCAFSPDGTRLAVCFHGGHVELFDVATGARIGDELRGHQGVPHGVRRVLFSPDGKTLVTAGQDARVIAWDVDTHAQRWCHQAAPGSFEALAFTPDGRRIVASHVKTGGGEENFLMVLNLATGEGTRHAMSSSIWALCFTPDGTELAMGGEAKTASICDAETFEERRVLNARKVVRLVNSPDGRWLYGASEMGGVMRWAHEQAAAEPTILTDETGPLWALTTAPDGTVHAIGTRGELHSLRGETPVERPTQHAHGKQINTIRATGDGLLTASWDGQLLRWQNGRADLLFKSQRRINAVARHADGRLFIAHGRGLTALTPDGAARLLAEGDFEAVAVDDTTIAAAGRGPLRLFTSEGEASVVVGVGKIRNIVSAGPRRWLVGTGSGEVSLIVDGVRRWTLADHGLDRLEFGSPHKDICDLAVLSDGFVSAGNDNTVRVYRWAADRPQIRLRIHTDCGIFNRISVSPDQRLLAVPSSGALRIVDLDDGSTLALLPALDHFGQNALTAACFIDDETLILGTETGRYFRLHLGGLR